MKRYLLLIFAALGLITFTAKELKAQDFSFSIGAGPGYYFPGYYPGYYYGPAYGYYYHRVYYRPDYYYGGYYRRHHRCHHWEDDDD